MNASIDASIDAMIKAAKESNPDLWNRTELVARIISPEAFVDAICHPEELQKLHLSRQKYMVSIAMSKAHDVLKALGVNTDTDWYDIMRRIAEGASDEREERKR